MCLIKKFCSSERNDLNLCLVLDKPPKSDSSSENNYIFFRYVANISSFSNAIFHFNKVFACTVLDVDSIVYETETILETAKSYLRW